MPHLPLQIPFHLISVRITWQQLLLRVSYNPIQLRLAATNPLLFLRDEHDSRIFQPFRISCARRCGCSQTLEKSWGHYPGCVDSLTLLKISSIRCFDAKGRPIYLSFSGLEDPWRQGGLEGVVNAPTHILKMRTQPVLRLVQELQSPLDLSPSLWARKPTEASHTHQASIM